ncbi:MAG: hypothetical protein ABJB74_09190 [Gemmatimonas sp.]
MYALSSANSRRSAFRTRGASHRVVKYRLPLILLLAGCERPATEFGHTFEQLPEDAIAPWHINVVAAPADSGMSLAWVPMPGTFTYSVRWRATNSTAWNERGLGTQTHVFVPHLPLGVPHQFIVSALHREHVSSADTLEETPRDRGVCGYASYGNLQTFACTRTALEGYMRSEEVSAENIRCRNRPVLDFGPDIPDCLYTAANNFHMLLLRPGDSTFHPSATPPSIKDTRSMFRHAIWPAGDPYTGLDPIVPTVLAEALSGSVSKYISAVTYLFDGGELSKSRVTRFLPISPVPGRYAIFHEGHGGLGTLIASDMIDFLLERGFEVYAMDMVLYGGNEVDRTVSDENHFDFPKHDDGVTSIVGYHMLPIKRVVDFIERTRPPVTTLLMMGRSGGGLMSYMYGALDPRITAVVSVAGGRPTSERLNSAYGVGDIGDPEQSAPEIFSVMRHEDLMVSAGSKGALMVWNAHDPCCFPVKSDDPVIDYLAQGGSRTGRIVRGYSDPLYSLHGLGPLGFAEVDRFLQDVMR